MMENNGTDGAARLPVGPLGPQPSSHLWEIDHPYYCNEGNYFANARDHGLGPHYKTLHGFLSEWEEADFDMNLLFRWDWREGDEEASNFTGDVNYRNGTLTVFWMGQRKGLFNWCTVEVCRADEPAVIAFLQPRMEHLVKLWTPLRLSPVAEGSAERASPQIAPEPPHDR